MAMDDVLSVPAVYSTRASCAYAYSVCVLCAHAIVRVGSALTRAVLVLQVEVESRASRRELAHAAQLPHVRTQVRLEVAAWRWRGTWQRLSVCPPVGATTNLRSHKDMDDNGSGTGRSGQGRARALTPWRGVAWREAEARGRRTGTAAPTRRSQSPPCRLRVWTRSRCGVTRSAAERAAAGCGGKAARRRTGSGGGGHGEVARQGPV